MKTQCDLCNTEYNVKFDKIGKVAKCKKCGVRFTIIDRSEIITADVVGSPHKRNIAMVIGLSLLIITVLGVRVTLEMQHAKELEAKRVAEVANKERMAALVKADADRKAKAEKRAKAKREAEKRKKERDRKLEQERREAEKQFQQDVANQKRAARIKREGASSDHVTYKLLAEDYVKQTLNYPSAAKFHIFGTSSKLVHGDNGKKTWLVKGNVTVMNGFGAKYVQTYIVAIDAKTNSLVIPVKIGDPN